MPTPAIATAASRLRRAPNPCTDLETFGGTQMTAPCLRTLPGTGKPLRVPNHNPHVGGSSPLSGIRYRAKFGAMARRFLG